MGLGGRVPVFVLVEFIQIGIVRSGPTNICIVVGGDGGILEDKVTACCWEHGCVWAGGYVVVYVVASELVCVDVHLGFRR